MKKLLIEYSQIIGYTVTGLIFSMAVFLLFLNFYHYNDVNNKYYLTDADLQIYKDMDDKISNITSNISSFDINSYNGDLNKSGLNNMKNKLAICVEKLTDKNMRKIVEKKELTILDVYNYQQFFQANVANECLVKQLYDLTNPEDNSISIDGLVQVAPFLKDSIDALINYTTFVQASMKNNSSYSFNSDISRLNLLSPTRDSYYEVRDAYFKSIDLVYDISLWFKETSGR